MDFNEEGHNEINNNDAFMFNYLDNGSSVLQNAAHPMPKVAGEVPIIHPIYGFEHNARSMSGYEDCMQEQVGSPDSSTSSSPKLTNSGRMRASSLNSRAYPNRSTAHLTQQQINRKRQRATPEQLIVLEDAFSQNPSPDAREREQISLIINMTERSVQIWFQNRRAKTRSAQKRGVMEDFPHQAGAFDIRPGPLGRSNSIDQSTLYTFPGLNIANGPCQSLTQTIARVKCRSLTIGSWRRIACITDVLVLAIVYEKALCAFYINSGDTGYKIEFPLDNIATLDLRFISSPAPSEMGRVVLTLSTAPSFFLQSYNTWGWERCNDFSENQQATTTLEHSIIGVYAQFRQALVELVSVHKELASRITFEPSQEHSPHAHTQSSLPLESSTGLCLAEKPSTTPHYRHKVFEGSHDFPAKFPEKITGGRLSHRRTRSRSAPIAVDLSFMNQCQTNSPFRSSNLQALGIDPSYRYNPEISGKRHVSGPEFTDGLCTPTTAGTSNYQDSWFAASYGNTPIFDKDISQLPSPIPGMAAQFNLSIAAQDFGDTALSSQYDLTSQAQFDSFSAYQNMPLCTPPSTQTLSTQFNLTQSLPELMRLDSVSEASTLLDAQYNDQTEDALYTTPTQISQAGPYHHDL